MVGAEEVQVDLGEDTEEAVTEDGEAEVDVVVIGEAMVTEMEFTRRTEERSSMFLKKSSLFHQERRSSNKSK